MEVLKMRPGLFKEEAQIDTRISFAPFVRFLKEKAQNDNDARARFYQKMIERFESNPEVLLPLEMEDLDRYKEYLDIVTAAVFPIMTDSDKDVYGIGVPYRFSIFYYSTLFKHLFTETGKDGLAVVPNGLSMDKINKDRRGWLYKQILQRFYGYEINYDNSIIHNVISHETGLRRYFKLQLDARFMDIKVKGELPQLDEDMACNHSSIDDMAALLPLSLFSLEGFVIWTVQDVTRDEMMNHIKNLVLKVRDENEAKSYQHLNEGLQAMLENKDIAVHVMPFLKVKNKYVLESKFASSSVILGMQGNEKQQQQLYQQLVKFLENNKDPLVINSLDDVSLTLYPFLKFLPHKGVKSFVLLGIEYENELLGMVEIASPEVNGLPFQKVAKIEYLLPLVTLMLRKSVDIQTAKINNVIKQQFTALQPSVEWKFVDAAWQYLHNPEKGKKDIENITFREVYPLYGAIDVRNSTVERSMALQEDLREQLQLIQQCLERMEKELDLPLLEELAFKNNTLMNNISQSLIAEEESQVNEFLDYEIAPTFRHLYDSYPSLQPMLANYFDTVNKTEGHVFHHRRRYEESLARINTEINEMLEKERDAIQNSFPCYFEKYRTDGVEYNIYIGQSIAQNKKFDLLYLRNLQLWQLTSMAGIARLTHQLMHELEVPLQTTQLILIHSNPIDISFRLDERRFDVEGAYNIRYEIIKKRIDKVHVRDTGERLTQPGKIALVFNYAREAEEYRKYIHFLQNKNILLPEIEMLELEELQGISGLKAMRVSINMEYK
ncbi:hypothetical protein GA0116948_11113 [Chitinophaga costaii]|uniref:GAF domain-containing protein n=1 Tax=Chitinophaga costaii TaxID=1335309 RepID=A0A1C4F1P2_9BACT|nr:hypothetical protein [Chitinophaga costaii]SCC49603.1 hypothetical protein GA0116948_11113 [Chitinophaga costaii]